jgi:uncharacterized protein YchJ
MGQPVILTKCRVVVNGEEYDAERVEVTNDSEVIAVSSGWQKASAAGLATAGVDSFYRDPDDLVTVPVRRVECPGRNALCWCGSGTKAKRCCWRAS